MGPNLCYNYHAEDRFQEPDEQDEEKFYQTEPNKKEKVIKQIYILVYIMITYFYKVKSVNFEEYYIDKSNIISEFKYINQLKQDYINL
jgi:hypothetical protein